MSINAMPLIDAVQAPVAATTLYPAPPNTRTIIDKFTGTNTTGAAATLTVNLVKAAGSPGAANTIVAARSIGPGECYTFPELAGHVLGPGDFISTTSSAVAITVRASGREVV